MASLYHRLRNLEIQTLLNFRLPLPLYHVHDIRTASPTRINTQVFNYTFFKYIEL